MIMAIFAPARAQWTEPVRIGAPGGVLYPQILAKGDTLHAVYSNNRDGWKIGYVRSTDGGESWSDQEVLSDTANTTLTYFPHIVDQDNALMILWLCEFSHWPYNNNIGSRVSHDYGLTWEPVEYILDPGWGYPFYLTASGVGTVINVITSGAPVDTMIFYNIRSTDFGQSWSEPVELFSIPEGGINDQAQSSETVHYAWSGRLVGDNQVEIYYMRSLDGGINWSPSMVLSDSDQYHSQLPAIAADDLGNVGATWMDYKFAPPGATGDIFIKESADSGTSWTTESYLTGNHLAVRSDLVVMNDKIHVAWEDESQSVLHRRIYYISSTDNGASWSEPYWIDGTDDDSWNPALAASNGNIYVVWADNRPDPGIGLYFSKYQNQTGMVENEPVTPRSEILNAYPNPFNSRIALSLKMVKGGEAELKIYDVKGRLVKTIFKGGNLEKGVHKFTWDATDAKGKDVSSGLYFAVAGTPQGKITKTLTLIR
jgi:hypothetical protein